MVNRIAATDSCGVTESKSMSQYGQMSSESILTREICTLSYNHCTIYRPNDIKIFRAEEQRYIKINKQTDREKKNINGHLVRPKSVRSKHIKCKTYYEPL